MSNQELLVEYLTQICGAREVKSRSRKYRQFKSRKHPGKFYFLGRNGAVRLGKSVSSSVSLTAFVNIKKIRNLIQAFMEKVERSESCDS